VSVQIYKCFIASPSDTQSERNVCDKVFSEINKTLGEYLNFRIESKKWEDDARPAFGTDGQAVINEQLLNDYQLFIGIMWNKFGTPTPRAGSGTEEEFNHAYRKHSNKDGIEILFYFNDEAINANQLDLKQVKKVRDFKEKVSSLGGLYSSYTGFTDFEVKLKKHLSDYFLKTLQNNHADLSSIETSKKNPVNPTSEESTSLILKNRLKKSLCLFSNQPFIWVEPVISKTNDISRDANENFSSCIEISSLIKSPESTIIKAPPQFGLTSLAHYLVKEAWSKDYLWVYLDARKVNRSAVTKSISKELKELNLENRKIDCIVLDAWIISEVGAKKLLRNLCHDYKDTPIIVMQTIDDSDFKEGDEKENINRDFNHLHLLALPRAQIRKVISAYNKEKSIGDEDTVLNKIVKDLEVLNIHRTPLNCLTLLKVSEVYFDESPVNRTKMIEMVLFVLFDVGEVPTYKAKPDLKDCEYVLGRFCESLIHHNKYQFSREQFLKELELFCSDKLIRLDVSVVFDILFSNNIIIMKDLDFIFRASYWIYYFAAKRMHFDQSFRDYIFLEKKYISFPEIIEFYTGIDRNREDVLKILIKDLKEACDLVDNKTGLPIELNPYQGAEWNPSEETLIKMQTEISDEVLNSNLPESLKDKHADQNYDQLKPYDQSIQTILSDYSLVLLIQQVKACSRALRNSDYVDPEIKKELLKVITRGWAQVSKIIFALAPILAKEGYVSFEGQAFNLAGNFSKSFEDRMNQIFTCNPITVVNYFKNDLFSNKIGPLLFDGINSETNDLAKHQLILLLIAERPPEWKKNVEQYITRISKNSFYLFDIVNCLRTQYRYSYATELELQEISYLLKMGLAKHELGIDKPNFKNIKRISNTSLPKRETKS
jgi:hypothetical protein